MVMSATPESGHVQCTSSCLLWAISGLMQCSNWDRYSITSPAARMAFLARWIALTVEMPPEGHDVTQPVQIPFGQKAGAAPLRPTRHARPSSVPSGCLTATMKTLAPGLRSVRSPTS
jgi:hypothetical protein